MGRQLMIVGALMFLVGAAFEFGRKFGLGSLPGDMSFRQGSFTFYFPLGTSILLSLILSLLFWFFRR